MDRIQELIQQFYQTREEKLYQEAAKLLKTEQTIWAAFCSTTRNYYMAQEHGIHTAYIFTDKSYFDDFQDHMQEQGILLDAVKNPPEHRIAFLADLYRSGFEMLLINNGHFHLGVDLFDVAEKPDYSKHPQLKEPVSNPSFLRAADYFFQSVHASKPDRNCELKMFQELYDATLLMPIDASCLENGSIAGKKELPPDSRMRVPMVTDKQGKHYRIYFTDWQEFRKFDRENKYKLCKAGYRELCNDCKKADGIVINPHGVNLRLDMELLEAVERVIDGSIKEDANQKRISSIRITEPKNVPDAMIESLTNTVKDHKTIKALYLKLISKDDAVRPNYLVVLDQEETDKTLYDAIAKAVMPHTAGLDLEITSIQKPLGRKVAATSQPVYKRRRFGVFR